VNKLKKRLITWLLIGAFLVGSYLFVPLYIVSLISVFLYILCVEWPPLAGPVTGKRFLLLTPLFLVAPCISLIYLVILALVSFRGVIPLFPLYPFIVAWSFDTASYAVGTMFGRHKMVPKISPGKTWEGFFGGLVVLIILHHLIIVDVVHATLCAGLMALLAFSGDLLVSFLKRKTGVKDTGTFLPGHGGLLDRFDSVMFVAIATVVLIQIYFK